MTLVLRSILGQTPAKAATDRCLQVSVATAFAGGSKWMQKAKVPKRQMGKQAKPVSGGTPRGPPGQ